MICVERPEPSAPSTTNNLPLSRCRSTPGIPCPYHFFGEVVGITILLRICRALGTFFIIPGAYIAKDRSYSRQAAAPPAAALPPARSHRSPENRIPCSSPGTAPIYGPGKFGNSHRDRRKDAGPCPLRNILAEDGHPKSVAAKFRASF